jgi:hypothetical protein
MRTQGFRTHVLLVLVGAAGVVLSLSRLWYARTPKPVKQADLDIGDVNGPLYGLFHGLQRWVTGTNGDTGWHALGPLASVIAGLAALTAVSALASTLPATQGVVRDPLRYGALALVAIIGWKLVDPPGPNELWELRHGALLGAGAALVLISGAMPVAAAPHRMRTHAPSYMPPPPPSAWDYEPPPGAGSVAPPGPRG